MLTSRYPGQIKLRLGGSKNYPTVADGNLTLFEVLQAAGIRTVGISSHFYFTPERGVQQGFDEYDNAGAGTIAESNKDIAAPRIIPKVEAKLREFAASKQRFALFTHLFEPHSAYVRHTGIQYTLTGPAGLEERYDYEIQFTDRWLGKLVDVLEQTGLSDNTIVVVVSDHGEAFGLHRMDGKRMFFHGQTLYDELLRVPLVLRVPGVAPRVVDEPVRLVDVAPTIVDLLNLEVPREFRGRSLVPAMVGEPLAPAPVYAEILPSPSWPRSVRMLIHADGRRKFIHDATSGRKELYDVVDDPDERKNRSASSRNDVKELERELALWLAAEANR